MKLADYQINSIKKIYGNDSWVNNNTVNNSDVIEFYEKNDNYDRSIEFPDKICSQGGKHGLTKYPLKEERTDSLIESKLSYIAIATNIVRDTLSYFKILNSKDIDWENAYLPALSHIGNIELGSITYTDLEIKDKDTNPKLDNTTKKTVNFTFGKQIKNGISHTYELLNIIDYLLHKINAIYFMLNIVKHQNVVVTEYESIKNQNQQ